MYRTVMIDYDENIYEFWLMRSFGARAENKV